MIAIFFDTSDLYDGVIRLECYRRAAADEKKGYLPAYHFHILLENGEKAGFCELRVGQNMNSFYGGNIGYGIFPEYRSKGYATRAVRLLCDLAKKHSMPYALITTKPENLASRRVIEKSGGIFLDERDIPFDLPMYGAERTRCVRYKCHLR